MCVQLILQLWGSLRSKERIHPLGSRLDICVYTRCETILFINVMASH